jgi:putative peptidoglycan binding protein
MSQKFSWVTRFVGASAALGLLTLAGTAYAVVPLFSQTGITVGLGQSVSATVQNGVAVYVELNSSPTIASASVNGTQITVMGISPGSSSLTICATGTASDCANMNITVQVGAVSSISFSTNNFSLPIGGSQSVTVSGGNGTYTISSNSNASVVSTGLSGSTLTVSGLAAGSAAINVCDTSNTCGTLSVTINSSSASSISFGQNNISLAAGGSQVISLSGGNGTYNLSTNSNPSAVSASIASNAITVYAFASGSATITVCDTSNTNTCGTLSVTVTGSSSGNQIITFNPASPTVVVGQSSSVTISGNATGFFILSNANAGMAQASMGNGNTLTIYGVAVGMDSITVCAVGGAGCTPLSVTITGPTTATVTPTTTTATPAVTQTTTVTPTTQGTASVVVNAALLTEIQALQTAVTQVLAQIQSIQTQLSQLVAQVNAGSGSTASTNVSAAANVSSNFTELLTLGSQDAQVTALQNRLAALGFYSGPVTGYYGSLTQSAVMKYQTAHGISATGSLGPSTRAALNTGN